MAHRIEVFTIVNDTRSTVMENKLRAFGISGAKVVEVYTINKDFDRDGLEKIAQMLSNPVSQRYEITPGSPRVVPVEFEYALEIGFLPGVTDNIATTAKETIEEAFKDKFTGEESVNTSTLIFLSTKDHTLTAEKVSEIGHSLANTLIQRITIKSRADFEKDGGMEVIVPKVHLAAHPKADVVNLNISEEELQKLSKEGVPNEDGTRRGPLALSKEYMEAIKAYFEKEGRSPNDIELESIAQTWSEHCKHTIFAASIDEIKNGLYKDYIKRATNEIRAAKGDKDICVSVFSDNAGGIIFDENWVITDKAETHNSPSALDPFGGSVTGIVGVNRDTIGFGKGAKPIINKYGFCTGMPDDEEPIYRDATKQDAMLPPKRILEGLVDGVNAGGNCSGIPTPQGFLYFHDSYKGKPLVFVGTVGLIPRKIDSKNSWEKQAQVGDKIVIVGGRVGQDGIHGATFSSEALTSGSPATAVQIGDPITQKKLSDAIVKEARDLNLYSSITDCGAGGISCSVAEMARECGGCKVELDKVPLKYPNLSPWQIWISESQERMTLAVPPDKIEEFTKLMTKRGVEVSVIGEYNNSGRCQVTYNGETIMDLEMEFLHNGLPDKTLTTTYTKTTHTEPSFPEPDHTESLLSMLARPNIASYEFISRQYDHNVQAGSVLQPLQGKGHVNARASVTKPFPTAKGAIICSQGINPLYSQIDTYDMSACAIDTAIRHAVAAGGNIDHMALMDNFCWCSSEEPERLGQLKASVKACYDYATAFGTPYISGKDSMFNDFKGYDKNGQATKISILPTLLISSIGVITDATKSVSIDAKIAGDLVYILGETKEEMGGSEYLAMKGFVGNSIPKVDAQKAVKLYKKFSESTDKRLIASAISPDFGGLGVALAKMAIAGQLGLEIDLGKLPFRADYVLFSESQSRIIVTIDPKRQTEFEEHFSDVPFALLGKVTAEKDFIIKGNDGTTPSEPIIKTDLSSLETAYHQLFKNW